MLIGIGPLHRRRRRTYQSKSVDGMREITNENALGSLAQGMTDVS